MFKMQLHSSEAFEDTRGVVVSLIACCVLLESPLVTKQVSSRADR
jgi:hypothetical protein